MKKILLSLGMIGLFAISASAQMYSLSATTTTNGFYLFSTNRASVYQIQITSPYACNVALYDCDSIGNPYYGTNWTNRAYSYTVTFPTNYAYSNIDQMGYTNWYTNTGIWTATVTNGVSTNALTPLFQGGCAAGTYAVYNVDALFMRGICATATTNASIVINYRAGR